MICPLCQAANRDTARFCSSCGKPLVQQPAVVVLAEEATNAPSHRAEAPEAAMADAPERIAEMDARIEGARPLPAPADLSDDEEAAAPVSPVAPAETAPGGTIAAANAAAPEPGQPDAGAPIPAATEPMGASGSSPETRPADVQAPAPLTPGTIIVGRFEIAKLLATQAGANLYEASDLMVCPACGFTDNSPDDAYCIECGVERRSVTRQLQEAFSPATLGGDASAGFTQGDRFYLLIAGQSETAAAELPAAPGMLALSAGYASHVGMVRELDEDSLCVFTLAGVYESVAAPVLGLFIVADGMGGHEGGEVASKLAVQRIAEQLIKRVLLPRFTGKSEADRDFVGQLLRKAIADANKEIYGLAQQRANDMGCTLTMAMVVDGTAYIANVGDSRTYIQRAGQLRQVTKDHSLVASLVTAGVIQPEEIFTHPERNVIYRSIGTGATVEADVFTESLASGDMLVVCCDGLWEAIRDEGIENVLLAYPDPQAACIELVRQANLAGGEDNISVIVIRVQAVSASALAP